MGFEVFKYQSRSTNNGIHNTVGAYHQGFETKNMAILYKVV